MLFPQASFVLALTSVVAAAPYEKRSWGGSDNSARPWWTPSAASSYLEFGKRVTGTGSSAPVCDLSAASMVTDAGLSLFQVAIGRGTQNYTCDLTNDTAIPVAIGAIATLFNVSCIAADQPDLLEMLPGIALDLPVPSTEDTDSPAYQDMSGHHYFLDSSTPFFNMDTTLHEYGAGAFKKVNTSDAPADAPLGQYGQGDGSVAWLKLDARNSTGQIFQEVYRINTAGGQPPTTCTGMSAAFEVQYSAEYWLWSS